MMKNKMIHLQRENLTEQKEREPIEEQKITIK